MKIIGTIVEYNPLHNGHLYAIKQIKKESNADIVVAVMSGNFTMRGELSIFDKFEKTSQALKAGIDIVIELPFVYSVQSADYFAKETTRLLELAGIEELWIGSEQNNPQLYEEAYQQWIAKQNQESILNSLQKGNSYKSATSSLLPFESNDLLGFCYYKAIKEQNLSYTLHTIQRKGAGYLDELPQEFASAYSLRKNPSLMKSYCPSYIQQNHMKTAQPLFGYLKYQILNQSISSLGQMAFVEEGIEHQLKKIKDYNTLSDYKNSLITKRYTESRINRMLLNILFNITKEDIQQIRLSPISFLRVLGYDLKGSMYLNQLKKKTPIKTNIKDGIHPIYDIELKITKLLDAIYKTNTFELEQKGPIEVSIK